MSQLQTFTAELARWDIAFPIFLIILGLFIRWITPGRSDQPPSYTPVPHQQSTPKDKVNRLPPFQRLPVDLLLYIADFLKPAHLASLALSSKTLLNTLGTRCIELEDGHKQAFLKILEAQQPNRLLCRVCWKFHPRHHHKSGLPRCRDRSCDIVWGKFNFGIDGYSLLFSDIQQIMNRRRFGPKFGISVDDIGFRRSNELCRFPLPHTEIARATIWGGKLYLRVDTWTRFKASDQIMKMAAIYARHNFCGNISQSKLNYYSFIAMLTPFVRCPTCMAEFRIRVTRTNDLEDTLHKTAWYRLGFRWDHYGIQWRQINNTVSVTALEPITEKEAVCRWHFKLGLDMERRRRNG